MLKILKKLICFIFILMTSIYVLSSIAMYSSNGKVFLFKFAVVLTDSMRPTLNANDIVLITKPNHLKVGDIITYNDKNSNMLVIHRVVDIDGDKLTTKGDNNNINDDTITENQVVGKYVMRLKYFGVILNFLKKPIVFSVVMTFITYLFIYNYNKKSEVIHNASK